MHTNTTKSPLWRSLRSGGLALAGGMTLAACSLEVDNPTMIEDADLNDPKAISAISAGVAGDYAYSMITPGGGGLINAGAMLTDELVHVGTWVGLRGPSDGESRDDWVESQSRWAEPSRARWAAENAIERISGILKGEGKDPASNPDVAHVTLWAGHSNRAMGDAFCNAVINGGGLEPHTKFYERAEKFFRDAVARATAAKKSDYRLSALGGRAHVRMMRGDWAGAVADAGQIPIGFVFYQAHKDNERERNQMYWWGFRRNETSVWGTPFEQWGLNKSDAKSTGDPRVAFDDSKKKGGDGRRPFYRQLKYTSYDEEIAVVRGTEMRLIEAEAALVKGDVATAVAKINEVRAYHNKASGYKLPLVSASSVDEAWPLLMKERGIELWLEGKRLPDLRRWAKVPGKVPFSVVRGEVAGKPATADPQLNVLDTEVMKQQKDMCIQVSKDEKNAPRSS
jgi:hypothetical protein